MHTSENPLCLKHAKAGAFSLCVFLLEPWKTIFHDIYEQLRNYKAQLGSFQLSGCKIQHRYVFMTPTWESQRYPRLDFQGSELFADHGRRCVVVWQRTQEIPKKEGWLRGRCQVGVEMTVRMTIGQQSWSVFSLAAARPKAMLPEVATFDANSLLEISFLCARSLSEG